MNARSETTAAKTQTAKSAAADGALVLHEKSQEQAGGTSGQTPASGPRGERRSYPHPEREEHSQIGQQAHPLRLPIRLLLQRADPAYRL